MQDDYDASRRHLGEDGLIRLARLEEQFRAMVLRMDAHIADSARLHREHSDLVKKLDDRADRHDIMLARLLAGLALAFLIIQLVSPYILNALNAPRVGP